MNKKLLIALALILVVAMGAFVACDKKEPDKGDEHTHAYTQWAHDDAQHWKVCSCGDADNATKTAHTFVDGECECGFTQAELGDWEFDQEKHWLTDDNGAVDKTTEAAHIYGNGSSCVVCGRYSLKAEVLSVVNTLNSYSLVIEKLTVPSSDQDVEISLLNAHIGLDDNGKLFAWATLSATSDIILPIKADGTTTTINLKQGLQLVVKNETAYITGVTNSANKYNDYIVDSAEGFIELPLEYVADMILQELLDLDVTYAQLVESIPAFLAELDSYSETVVAALEFIGSLGATTESAADDSDDAIPSFISVTKNADGSKVYSLNFDALRAINNILATNTVGDYLTAIFGEDYATDIPATIAAAFKLTIGDLVDAVEEQTGMTLDELIAVGNGIVATIMEDDTITIDALLQQAGILQEGVTLKELLSDNVVKAYTLENLLDLIQGDVEDKITSEDLVADVSSVIENYSSLTIYDIIGSLMSMSDEDVNVTIGAQIGLLFGQAIDVIDEYLDVFANVDKDGVLQNVTIKLGFDSSFTLDENSPFNSMVDSLKGLSGTISYKRGVEIENEDDIIDSVEDNIDEIADAIAKDILKDENSVQAFVNDNLIWDDEYEEIVSLEKNADGDWILTIKGYYDYSYMSADARVSAIKELVGWTDKTEVLAFEYGYVYTSTINLNKDFVNFTFNDAACNGKRAGEIQAVCKKEIIGIYMFGTDKNKKVTDLLDAEQLGAVLQYLKDDGAYAYDYLTEEYLESNVYNTRDFSFIYDTVNKSIVVDTEYDGVHNWVPTQEIDEDSLSCAYYTVVTEKCTICNATRKTYHIGEHDYEWSDYECDGDCEADGAVSHYRCKVCGDIKRSTEKRYSHVLTDVVEGDCTSSEFNGTCDVCGAQVSYSEHDYYGKSLIYYGDGAVMTWWCCERCTSGAYWDLHMDAEGNFGWTVEYIEGGEVITTQDGYVFAEIDGVYYYKYNTETGVYEFYFDNATGERVPYVAA